MFWEENGGRGVDWASKGEGMAKFFMVVHSGPPNLHYPNSYLQTPLYLALKVKQPSIRIFLWAGVFDELGHGSVRWLCGILL